MRGRAADDPVHDVLTDQASSAVDKALQERAAAEQRFADAHQAWVDAGQEGVEPVKAHYVKVQCNSSILTASLVSERLDAKGDKSLKPVLQVLGAAAAAECGFGDKLSPDAKACCGVFECIGLVVRVMEADTGASFTILIVLPSLLVHAATTATIINIAIALVHGPQPASCNASLWRLSHYLHGQGRSGVGQPTLDVDTNAIVMQRAL